MSEVARTGFLIMGTKEKSEGNVFHGHHLHPFPIWAGFRVAFPCFILREQFGYRYAKTARNERSELYGDFGRY
jgi:hypothetical protein